LSVKKFDKGIPDMTHSGKLTKTIRKKELGIFLGLMGLILLFSIANPRFVSLDNFLNILRQVSIVGIMACGMTCVIVCGDIDLSLGSIYGMSAMLSGFMMLKGIPIPVAIMVSLLIGGTAGLINGIVCTYLRVPAIIATLGMQYMARGLSLILTSGGVINLMTPTAARINPHIKDFLAIGSGKLFGVIPNMAIIYAVIAAISYFFYQKTLLGFQMRAVGGNANAAAASGINGNLIRIISFVILGVFAAFAGMLNFSFLNSVQGTMGQGLEMDVIAASIIGGASLSGGEATMIGTIIGVLIMGVLRTGLVYMGVSAYLQMVLIGVVIIVTVAADMMTKK
jgi:ribose/xylose/arabinose/galactoside ABC-type transport system permease subunit